MAFLTIKELYTHLYQENEETISRGDKTIPQAAIDAGIAEAKGYLVNRYDADKAFNATGSKRNALLLTFVKDISVWHFVNLGNACVDMELRQLRYERAIDWLEKVQQGNVVADLPSKEADPDAFPGKNNPLGDIAFGSNPKRHQHF